MIETIKKGFYTGIGITLRGTEKIRSWADEIVRENNLSEEEGKKFTDEILEESRKAREDVQKLINEKIHQTVTNLGLAKKSELEKLEKRLKELEDKISHHS